MGYASSELLKLTGAQTISDAAVKLGIVGPGVGNVAAFDESDWYRAGAETFLLRFRLETAQSTYHCVIKACVAFSVADALAHVLNRWVARRMALAALGVSTPLFYFAGDGVVVEEFVPFAFWETLRHADDSVRIRLLSSAVDYAAALTNLGFAPIEAFRDLRSRGNDAVCIDFGEDLGELGVSPGTSFRLFDQLMGAALVERAELSETTISVLRERFLRAVEPS